MSKWYEIADISSIDSPNLLVYPKRVAQNIGNMVSMVGDPTRLRPHIKTHKTAEGIHMMMDAGIRKFKCATIAEAELLGICGAVPVRKGAIWWFTGRDREGSPVVLTACLPPALLND
jgi:hypothetical protein